MAVSAKNDWRSIQKKTFTSWQSLADYLELDEIQRQEILPHSRFPLKLPFRLAEKIQKRTLNDPILKQFLPVIDEEKESSEGFSCDPVGDVSSRRLPRLLHKYAGRALLMPTSVCAMHCRYCFRRHFDYAEGTEGADYRHELAYLQGDESIKEVILSGGDPLSLPNAPLGRLLRQLGEITHLKKLRIHTRLPIAIPERIDEEFLSLVDAFPLQIVMVLHCNHPNELDEGLFKALRPLQQRGVVLLNQAVLLKGVNDDADTLKQLCQELSDHGVLPYYLHQLDKVKGASHFEVDESRGIALVEELGGQLPGYVVPRYVKEIAGEPGKLQIVP